MQQIKLEFYLHKPLLTLVSRIPQLVQEVPALPVLADSRNNTTMNIAEVFPSE